MEMDDYNNFEKPLVGRYGVVRMLILLGLLYGLSRLKDIRRVFEYHGAEHKVVFNFESGQPVTVENAVEPSHRIEVRLTNTYIRSHRIAMTNWMFGPYRRARNSGMV